MSTFSSRPEAVDATVLPPETVFDPVVEAGPLARSLAPRMCALDGHSSVDGHSRSCAWYHGIWPYLRLLGITASPQRHERFFFTTLRSMAGTGQFGRVLISGTADHAMAAHIVRAFRAEGAGVDLTVLDRCPTPIELCRWYGSQVGVAVEGVAGDIFAVAVDGKALEHDVICTHSFLSQFAARDRPELLARWRGLLRPGGKVVTTTRITPMVPATESLSFTRAQVEDFCAGVASRAAEAGSHLDLPVDDLLAASRRFAELSVAHPTPSVADVVTLFHRSGFRLERLEVRRLGAGAVTRDSGPGTTQPALYAEVVASVG